MSTTFEKLSSNKVKLTFVIDAAQFGDAIQKAYRKTVKRYKIPGFRPGKAPMIVIENHYGESVFYEDAFDILFPEAYREAIKEHGIDPVDRPELDIEQMNKGEELKFSVEVFVSPDVELGKYTQLGIVKTIDEVTDDDVNADIERARDSAARFIEVTDRPAKLDDQLNINFAGYIEGEPFEGGANDNHELTLGSGQFIPGFEEQLVGANVGDELDVNVTFPEDYQAEELAGKPAVFKVKVNSIREKEVPELDDEFVKEVSETADTVADYKAEIREKLEKAAEDRANEAFESEVIEAVVENAEVDIPEAMINDQLDEMIRDMELRMKYQGMNMQDFLNYTGQTMESMREMYKPQAEERIKHRLVLEAIMKAESIEPTDEEIDAEIAKFAEQTKRDIDEFKQNLGENEKEYFKGLAKMQKTIEFLKNNAA